MRTSTGSRAAVLAGLARPVPARSVPHLVAAAVRARPDAVACEYQTRVTSYRDLWRGAVLVANVLRDLGIGPGDRVALWADRTDRMIIAALGVLIARAAYVPVDPQYPNARAVAILDAAGARAALYDGEAVADRPPALDPGALELRELLAALSTSDGPAVGRLPVASDPAYVMFTSGSTGQPKGVIVDHAALVNYCAWCVDLVGGGTGDTPLFTSLGFDHTVTPLWPTLGRGGRVVIAGGAWDQDVLFGPRNAPYALLKVTPSHLRFFERTGRPNYAHSTRLLMIGGERLDGGLIDSVRERLSGIRLLNHYGPTEATVGCCCHEFDTSTLPRSGGVPIGRPIWNTRLYVVDESLRPCAPGVAGELIVAGRAVARGYLNPGSAGDRFIDESALGGRSGRAYRTGDIVEHLPDGGLLFLGRNDDQTKVNGHRVELGELHTHALAAPGVADVAFDVRRDGPLAGVEAFVVPRPGARADAVTAAVRAALARNVAPALVPHRVMVVPRLVLNVHGKWDVAATRALADGDG